MTDTAKPLFIPLNGEFFDAFAAGTKNTEYRLYGPRWNEGTCPIGRRVVLSRGYGKARRLHGKIVDFSADRVVAGYEAFKRCYPDAVDPVAACIRIELEKS